MIQIGKYRFGFSAASTAVVFIVLSVCAMAAALRQARPEWPMPLHQILLINEGMALSATLVYGIIVHFVLAIINRIRNEH